MMTTGELVWKDQSTMERVAHIIEAIWNKTITFGNEGEGDIVCHIGEYWFYFWNNENITADLVTERTIHKYVGIFQLAQMILEAIIELDDDEYTYYCDILNFA